MVSSLLVDALRDPSGTIADLYTPVTNGDFAAVVTKHFSEVFQTQTAFDQIPVLDTAHPPECFGDRSLVRFRAMVQDTSGNPEMFLANLPDGKPGGWGLESSNIDGADHPIDYASLRECQVMWAVSIPGESEWCSRELDGDVDTSQPSGLLKQLHRKHKSPASKDQHVGVQVKMYDMALVETIRSTDCLNFVGILTREATSQDEDLDHIVEVPTLHVLFARSLPLGLLSRPYPTLHASSVDQTRQQLVEWIADEALGGDKQVAEWLLLSLISRVQSRHPPLHPPSVTVSNFPLPPATTSPPLASTPSLTLALSSASSSTSTLVSASQLDSALVADLASTSLSPTLDSELPETPATEAPRSSPKLNSTVTGLTWVPAIDSTPDSASASAPASASTTTSHPSTSAPTQLPAGSAAQAPTSPPPTLSHVLELLLPLATTIPLSIELLNTTIFSPTSREEDLHAGLLQLPPGSSVLLSECNINEGTVNSQGLDNIRAAQEAMGAQTINYVFPYSAFSFPTDLTFAVLVPGRASAFFKTDLNVRLDPSLNMGNEAAIVELQSKLYKPASAIRLPPAEQLAQFRDLIIGARGARLSVDATTSEHIQTDFVRERQESKGKVSADDLVLRMSIAKLLAQSTHAPSVTVEHWERTKEMDSERRARLVAA